jgi:hypothetical protein
VYTNRTEWKYTPRIRRWLIEALHYKLAMEEKHVNDPHGQVVYTPMLDASRDAKIMSVLPDYLTDEIMFARDQGSSPNSPIGFCNLTV